MIAKKNIGPLLGLFYGAVFGTLIMVVVHRYFPDISARVVVLLAVVSFVACCFAGMWVHVRSEQNKKLPTNGKELRRRTKEFYHWLDSQGRPRSRR